MAWDDYSYLLFLLGVIGISLVIKFTLVNVVDCSFSLSLAAAAVKMLVSIVSISSHAAHYGPEEWFTRSIIFALPFYLAPRLLRYIVTSLAVTARGAWENLRLTWFFAYRLLLLVVRDIPLWLFNAWFTVPLNSSHIKSNWDPFRRENERVAVAQPSDPTPPAALRMEKSWRPTLLSRQLVPNKRATLPVPALEDEDLSNVPGPPPGARRRYGSKGAVISILAVKKALLRAKTPATVLPKDTPAAPSTTPGTTPTSTTTTELPMAPYTSDMYPASFSVALSPVAARPLSASAGASPNTQPASSHTSESFNSSPAAPSPVESIAGLSSPDSPTRSTSSPFLKPSTTTRTSIPGAPVSPSFFRKITKPLPLNTKVLAATALIRAAPVGATPANTAPPSSPPTKSAAEFDTARLPLSLTPPLAIPSATSSSVTELVTFESLPRLPHSPANTNRSDPAPTGTTASISPRVPARNISSAVVSSPCTSSPPALRPCSGEPSNGTFETPWPDTLASNKAPREWVTTKGMIRRRFPRARIFVCAYLEKRWQQNIHRGRKRASPRYNFNIAQTKRRDEKCQATAPKPMPTGVSSEIQRANPTFVFDACGLPVAMDKVPKAHAPSPMELDDLDVEMIDAESSLGSVGPTRTRSTSSPRPPNQVLEVIMEDAQPDFWYFTPEETVAGNYVPGMDMEDVLPVKSKPTTKQRTPGLGYGHTPEAIRLQAGAATAEFQGVLMAESKSTGNSDTASQAEAGEKAVTQTDFATAMPISDNPSLVSPSSVQGSFAANAKYYIPATTMTSAVRTSQARGGGSLNQVRDWDTLLADLSRRMAKLGLRNYSVDSLSVMGSGNQAGGWKSSLEVDMGTETAKISHESHPNDNLTAKGGAGQTAELGTLGAHLSTGKTETSLESDPNDNLTTQTNTNHNGDWDCLEADLSAEMANNSRVSYPNDNLTAEEWRTKEIDFHMGIPPEVAERSRASTGSINNQVHSEPSPAETLAALQAANAVPSATTSPVEVDVPSRTNVPDRKILKAKKPRAKEDVRKLIYATAANQPTHAEEATKQKSEKSLFNLGPRLPTLGKSRFTTDISFASLSSLGHAAMIDPRAPGNIIPTIYQMSMDQPTVTSTNSTNQAGLSQQPRGRLSETTNRVLGDPRQASTASSDNSAGQQATDRMAVGPETTTLATLATTQVDSKFLDAAEEALKLSRTGGSSKDARTIQIFEEGCRTLEEKDLEGLWEKIGQAWHETGAQMAREHDLPGSNDWASVTTAWQKEMLEISRKAAKEFDSQGHIPTRDLNEMIGNKTFQMVHWSLRRGYDPESTGDAQFKWIPTGSKYMSQGGFEKVFLKKLRRKLTPESEFSRHLAPEK